MDCEKCPIKEYCRANITTDTSSKEIEEYRLCPLISLVKKQSYQQYKQSGTVVESNGKKIKVRY